MKFFLDTEFHEYKKQPKILGLNVGKPIYTIELISIGIISEGKEILDGEKQLGLQNGSLKLSEVIKGDISKEYYAICKDFDVKAAWDNEWLRENVLKSIYIDLHKLDTGENIRIDNKDLKKYDWRFYITFKRLINKYGKTKKQIAEEIKEFVGYQEPCEDVTCNQFHEYVAYKNNKPEFYAYGNKQCVVFYDFLKRNL